MSLEQLHFVYVSQLAPGCDRRDFDGLCRSTRSHHLERGIAGALLFDGLRFLHWVHGRREQVQQVVGAIVLDTRHTMVSMRLEAMLPGTDSQATWRAGFVDRAAMDAFVAQDCADGAAVLDAVAHLIDQAVLETGYWP